MPKQINFINYSKQKFIHRKQAKMSKKFNLKVSARMQQKCQSSVELVSFNQLILKSQEDSDLKKFQFDRIYYASDTNEKLFENILTVPTNLLFEGFSSMIFCLGSPNSGKTYTLAGKIRYSDEEFQEPGILTYLMRRLFTKFKHEVSLYSRYSVWCKFLFVEKNKLTNITNQINKTAPEKKTTLKFDPQLKKAKTTHNLQKNVQQSNLSDDEKMGKIQIKNYSHFKEIIQAVYQNNNNKRHTVIELSLQKQLVSGKSATSSITFVQFGSFFYNCPFREAEQLQMENQIQSLLNLLKNLSHSKQESANQLFQSSFLTNTLKENFLKSNSFQIMGLLDNSYQNNLRTLNFLDSLMQRRSDPKTTQTVKQDIKRQELFLKNLYQKHRRVLNLLSRCIGTELGSLEKGRKSRKSDGPVMNSFYKTCEKIKYANLKKVQNQKILEEIRKDIEKQDNQLKGIEQQYDTKIKGINLQKASILARKRQLQTICESIVAPPIKFNNTDYSLYWKPQQMDLNILPNQNNKTGNNHNNVGIIPQEEPIRQSVIDSQRQSKEENSKSPSVLLSHNELQAKNSSKKQPRKLIMKQNGQNGQNKKHKLNLRSGKNYERYERGQVFIPQLVQSKVQSQLKTEIGNLFKLLINKEKQIEQKQAILNANGNLSCNILMNKIKNREQFAKFNKYEAAECYRKFLQSEQGKQNNSQLYQNTIKINSPNNETTKSRLVNQSRIFNSTNKKQSNVKMLKKYNMNSLPISNFPSIQNCNNFDFNNKMKDYTIAQNYRQFMNNFDIQQKIEKDIEVKNNMSSLNAISMKSLATDKIIKN